MTESHKQDLNSLRIPELRALAGQLGLKGLSGLRKSELIARIQGAGTPVAAPAHADKPAQDSSAEESAESAGSAEGKNSERSENSQPESRSAARRARRNRARQQQRERQRAAQEARAEGREENQEESREADSRNGDASHEDKSAQAHDDRPEGRRKARQERRENSEEHDSASAQEQHDGDDSHEGHDNGDRGKHRNNRRNNRRNRRGRDRDGRDNRDNRDNSENDNHEDNLQPVAGIVDIVDNNTAFIRTTGYHPSPNDVYVNNQIVRRNGLRSGDAVIGYSKPGNNHQGGGRGRNRQKYANLARIESINGVAPDQMPQRPHFNKLTPLYPNQRLRLETEHNILTTRVIDLIMPIGKGQRALIVSPPKAGKTTILQNIANAIAHNNPECHLMVVLVDERPEEVTDMQRSVNGEVIASTFDRPPSEHTAVAELAIERAKRLVEEGKDVVVLLDSITRLGRAYNNSSPASGRILSGGVDSNALYPPKRFLGAARNIENGGSLTIIATALVETGSAGDAVIFEEFKGTGNAELKLDRKIAERRVFPAVDVHPSGTRKDELMLVPEEAKIMQKLRNILAQLDSQQAIDLLIRQLKKTKSNGEFLMQVASSAPMAAALEEEDYS